MNALYFGAPNLQTKDLNVLAENKGQYYGFHKKTWLFFWKETKIIEIYGEPKIECFFHKKTTHKSKGILHMHHIP